MASIKIKDFFNGPFFEIPKDQRGYAWEIQNIRDLFQDIIEQFGINLIRNEDFNEDNFMRYHFVT